MILYSVEPRHDVALSTNVNQTSNIPKHQQNEFGKTVKNSVSSIMNHFKGRVTKYADKQNIEFDWLAKFYDHIVHNNDDFLRIQNYIVENTQNWENDKFHNK